MRLRFLRLEQFRSYTSLELPLEGDMHLLIGPNGSGKTNILEAISVLALTKSLIADEEQHVVRWGTGHYRVRAGVTTDSGEDMLLEVVSQITPRKQKACFINDVRIPLTEMVGKLPAVIFLPQDLQLFSGPPAERRRFLDQLLCQGVPEYFRALTDFQKILKQRNALLRSIREGRAAPGDLEPWDAKAAEEGSTVIAARLELIGTFGLTLCDEIQQLGEQWTDVSVLYRHEGDARDRDALHGELLAQMRQYRERDVILQSTTVGPHRDDWTLIADRRDIATFGSRGQQRVCALALTSLEASYLELRRAEKPIILLDDVFSELDAEHQQAVLKTFRGHQLLLTATEMPPGAEGAVVWTVGGGEVLAAEELAIHE